MITRNNKTFDGNKLSKAIINGWYFKTAQYFERRPLDEQTLYDDWKYVTDAIRSKNVQMLRLVDENVNQLIWYCRMEGKTLLDVALLTENSDVVEFVFEKNPYANDES